MTETESDAGHGSVSLNAERRTLRIDDQRNARQVVVRRSKLVP